MRIGFVDFVRWAYDPDSVLREPMGGSQSALCYLSVELARSGHEVWIFNGVEQERTVQGVHVQPIEAGSLLRAVELGLDVLVVLNRAGKGRRLRDLLGPEQCIVLWVQHDMDQPRIADLGDPDERDSYNAFAFLTLWQRDRFVEAFGIEVERTGILRNAIAPVFQGLYEDGESVLARKASPPVLAYTSTPYRGLSLLLDAFPIIRDTHPEIELEVYSSLQVYQVAESEDQDRYGALYERCRQMPGVIYKGSVPQPELATALTRATLLAYPCIFPETSCIAVMEALAAGCGVVSTYL
ncbi:MAG: glycosyltransferase, partial [Myxococcota bacterium]|nr:glycosyltransferase [Myxococcota bacterium]